MKIKRDIPLVALCFAFIILSTVLLAVNISQEKVINRQNEVITLQQDKNFSQQTIIETLQEQLKNEKLVSDTLYDLAELHGNIQEERLVE